MIQKTNSVVHDKRIKRILEYNEDAKQITIGDQRFYQRKAKTFYPSVTYVLSFFPKGKFFENWMKDVGHNSDIIAKKAGDEGTETHKIIEDFLNGEEIFWINEYGKANYSLTVWQMALRFADFWNTLKPKLIATEQHIFSDKYQYAGTIDLVVEINGEVWLLDIKTSNSLHTSYDLQLAAYAQAWNENFDMPIQKTGIIWLKSNTRKADPSGKKIQGNGWFLKVPHNSYQDNLLSFLKVYDIFKLENPEMKPYSEKYATRIKLEP
jgi:hypothetical protein